MTKKKTGKKTRQVVRLRKASADDPIYSRGFTIGIRHSARSLPATTSEESPPPPKPSEGSESGPDNES